MQDLKTILEGVREFVMKKLSSELPEGITYHSIGHTIDVVKSAGEIAEQHGVEAHTKDLLEIACWFHDVGYIDDPTNHEMRSAEVAEKYLADQGLEDQDWQVVKSCILATKMPQNPTSELEEIICDADMMHLADTDYFDKACLLHKEIQKVKACTISEKDWLKMNKDFLNDHCFFTEYAREKYSFDVKENLRKVKSKLRLWK